MTWKRLLTVLIGLTLISYFSGLIPIGSRSVIPENNCTEIFKKVDQAPNFEGGDQGFMKYNEEHIFPMIAKSQNGVAKNMEFQYKMIVSKTGRIVDCEISSPFSKDLAEKVKSQIYKMPP